MRALSFDGQVLRVHTAHPTPNAAEGEAVVRLLCAGVSPIDVQICRGERAFTGVLGHQFVGVVESLNVAGQKKLARDASSLIGKRVVGLPIAYCGKCDLCTAGLSAHCRLRTITGSLGRDGCFAELFKVPIQSLVAVPDGIDDDQAVFAYELAEAVQTSNRLAIERKPFITVLGDNSLALLMAQVIARQNASVRLVGQDGEGSESCEKWGVKHRTISEAGRRADQDIVVECTGGTASFTVATQMVRPRGTIVLAASFGAEHQVDLDAVVLNELSIIGSSTGDGSMVSALDMLLRREVDVTGRISRRMKLSDGPAFMKNAVRPVMTKVVVEP
jgi:alcohol dehydrogenase